MAPLSTPVPAPASPRRHRGHGGFTLLETMIGLSLFVIAGLGVMEIIGLINQNSTANRALTAARMLVQAKISKAQTDTFTLSNKVYPASCIDPSLNAAAITAAGYTVIPDALDFVDTGTFTVVGSSDTGPVITGTMARSVATFEAASKTLLVTYTLTFTYRGKNYSVTQSTIRAPDQL